MIDPLPGSIAEAQRDARRGKPPASIYDPGLPMPSAVDMERCLLSCMMQAPDYGIMVVGAKIRPEHFSVEAHSLLWDLLVREINAGKLADPVSMSQVLRDLGLVEKVGGEAFVSEVYTASPNPEHVEHYAKLVHQKWRQREVVMHCSRAASEVLGGIEPQELEGIIGDLESRLMMITQETLNSATGLRTGEEVVMDALGRLRVRHQHKGQILGLQFGFPDLDRRVNGFQRGDFIVIGARPAMGKTSLATGFAENIALEAVNRSNRPVLMFTLEMSDVQIMERSLLSRARIALKKGRTGMFSDAEASVLYAFDKSLAGSRGKPYAERRQALIEASADAMDTYCQGRGIYDKKSEEELAAFISKSKVSIEQFASAVAATACGMFTFYDGYGVTVQELRSMMRQWLRRIGWKRECDDAVPPMVVVDYLQLVKASIKQNKGDPRLTSIEVCEALKGFSKETGIVILGLAQVKVNDKRPDAEPQMSDIKESGAFAEFPDYVFTLHRFSYYKKWDDLSDEKQEEYEKKAAGNRKALEASGLKEEDWGGEAYYAGLTKIGIKKARFCATDDVYAYFRGDEVRFIPITKDLYSNNDERREQRDDD